MLFVMLAWVFALLEFHTREYASVRQHYLKGSDDPNQWRDLHMAEADGTLVGDVQHLRQPWEGLGTGLVFLGGEGHHCFKVCGVKLSAGGLWTCDGYGFCCHIAASTVRGSNTAPVSNIASSTTSQ
jgi:hypothetical protein